MRMAVQLLQSGRINAADASDALQVLDRQIDVLLGNIDDLSELLRMAAGTFVLNSAANDLNLVLDALSGRSSLRRALDARRQSLRCIPCESAIIADHDPVRIALLVEYLVQKCGEQAAPGSELTIELRPDSGTAELRISGFAPSPAFGDELAYLIGKDANEAPAARTILMREIARLHGISFWCEGQARDLVLRMAADPANRACSA